MLEFDNIYDLEIRHGNLKVIKKVNQTKVVVQY